MTQKIFDAVIVGAGPIGLACGIEAKKKNLNTIIFDEGPLVNSIYNYPINMTFFSTSERLEIGDVPFISHGFKPTRTEALEYYRRVKNHWNLNVHLYEKIVDIIDEISLFKIITKKGEYFSKNVIIATGFYRIPNLMNIPGEDLPKVFHYYREPHPFADMNVAIVGGGNSAVDAALEIFRRNANVTLIIKDEWIDESVKAWIVPDIENRIKFNEIKTYFNSYLTEIRSDEVDIQTPEGKLTIRNDFVLAMTGYQPDYGLLTKAGIKISNDNFEQPVFDNETFESNKKGIFLAGVVCGGKNTNKWNIENARFHAERVINNLRM